MEPWDGPAAVTFSDGRWVGAILDRNGLRPARYVLSDEGVLVLASEVGVIRVPEDQITRRGRLGPGQMIAVDLQQNKLLEDHLIKKQLTQGKLYGKWLNQSLWRFDSRGRIEELTAPNYDEAEFQKRIHAMGYTQEDLEMVIKPMAADGYDPTFSMGDDTPLAVLSQQPRPQGASRTVEGIGVDLEQAMLIFPKNKGEGVKHFGGAKPDKFRPADVQIRFEDVSIGLAGQAVDPIGGYDQIEVIGPRYLWQLSQVGNIGLENQPDPQFPAAFLQNEQQNPPRHPSENITPHPDDFIPIMDVNGFPQHKGVRNLLVGFGIGLAE
jgi:hypothetical protein